jgi:hypothetical protein
MEETAAAVLEDAELVRRCRLVSGGVHGESERLLRECGRKDRRDAIAV